MWVLAGLLAVPVALLHMAGLPLIWAVVITFSASMALALAAAAKH